MIDRAGVRGAVQLSATRIGRTELGGGIASIDDEALSVITGSSTDDAPLRIRLASIDAASLSGHELAVALRDGTLITFVSEHAAKLHDHLLMRCRTLPELTHALRAFGSRRGRRGFRDSAPSDQQRFFAPFLEARRKAGGAGAPAAVIAAFDAASLITALEATLDTFAAERHGDYGPARRALHAELMDLSEPLRLALEALRAAATEATTGADDLRLWRIWAMQLRDTFEAADRVWLTLDVALDATPWRP
jgi:hypothetical protein